jgi:uncharacterized OB-fold protein
MIGVIISKKEYEEYQQLKKKDTPMKKKYIGQKRIRMTICPVCNYVVDNAVPRQNYCDRCGQRLMD